MHPKLTLNPWAIATLAALCFVLVGADSIGPNVPSLFSRIVSTNKTADAWRTALGTGSGTDLTTVSNAQVTTAGNLVTVSNAQVTTAGNLVTVSNAQIATAANLLSVSNSLTTTAGDLVTVSNAQVTTAGNLVTVSNALDTKPTVALTNLMLLNSNNAPTATNSFDARKLLSAGETMWNQTPFRVLYSAPTNIYISSLATSSVAAVEVNGAFNLLTPIFEGTLPAIGSNSLVYIAFTVVRPQANIGGGQFVAYVGTNTNYWGISGALLGTARGVSALTAVGLLQADASYTSASGTASFASGTASMFPVATNLVGDVSQPWQFRLGAYGTSEWTNCWLAGFQILEHRRSP